MDTAIAKTYEDARYMSADHAGPMVFQESQGTNAELFTP